MPRARQYPEETPIAALERRLAILEGIIQTGNWRPWTPAYTNLTIGAGTVLARYTGSPGKLVVAQYRLDFAGDTTIDGTNPTISAPITPRAGYQVNRTPLGLVMLRDDGNANHPGVASLDTTGVIEIMALLASGTHLETAAVTATVPHTWGNLDVIAFTVAFEAAV